MQNHLPKTDDLMLQTLRRPRETTSERPKVIRTSCVLHIVTWTCASHHNGVHFFDISTSKSGPFLVCFVHFNFETCAFSTFQLQKELRTCGGFSFLTSNVLRATTACNFSSLIRPDGSAPAALASLLFDPLEPQIIGKTP